MLGKMGSAGRWKGETKRGWTHVDLCDWAKGRELLPQIVFGGAEGEVAYVYSVGRGEGGGWREGGRRVG